MKKRPLKDHLTEIKFLLAVFEHLYEFLLSEPERDLIIDIENLGFAFALEEPLVH